MASFSSNLVRTFLAHTVGMVIALGTGVLTARVLGPADRGLYSLCVTLMALGIALANFQLGASSIFHLLRERRPAAAVFGGALVQSVGLGVLAGLVLALGRPLFGTAFEQLSSRPVLVVAMLVPLGVVDLVLSQMFRALDRFDLFNIHQLLAPALQLVALGVALGLGGGLVEALQALLAAYAALLAWTLVTLLRVVRPSFRDRSAWGSLLRFGGRMQGAGVFNQVEARLAVFLVASFLRPEDIAYYAIGEALVERMQSISLNIGTVLLPRLARESDALAAATTAIVCRSTMLVISGFVVVLAILSRPLIVGLYGSEYAPAIAPMLVLLPSAVLRSGSMVLTRFMISTNRLRVVATLNAISLVVRSALLVALVPTIGTIGAAAAASAACLFHLSAAAVSFRRASGLGFREIALVDRSDLRRIFHATRSGIGLRPERAR
jgi:O-antigen/teichoic acid export membrane protein